MQLSRRSKDPSVSKGSPLQKCVGSSRPTPHADTTLLLAPRQTLRSWVLLRLQRPGMENSSRAERDLFQTCQSTTFAVWSLHVEFHVTSWLLKLVPE